MLGRMEPTSSIPIPGSFRQPVAGAEPGRQLGDAPAEVTLVLRRRSALPPDLVAGPQTVSPAQLRERFGADPADVDVARQALVDAGAEILQIDPGSRRIRARGTGLAALFGADLVAATSPDPVSGRPVVHRARAGDLTVPAELAGIVVAVLGLDDRPQARAHFRVAAAAATTVSYTPDQVAAVYAFPAGTDGSGQTVAVVELGGGFAQADLDAYFAELSLPTPQVTAVSVDGAANQPGSDPHGADGEVLLDIEVVGATAPGAHQLVYFAPNTDAGFLDAISQAVHTEPAPTAVTISWGGPEDSWTAQARSAMDDVFADAAALGVTVTAASGDDGSTDREADGQPHVDFPAASPHVLGCGGTSLPAAAGAETVWNDGSGQGATGGGVSIVFARPAWQDGVGVPAPAAGNGAAAGVEGTATGVEGDGRGVPDVSGVADPVTGYRIRVDGSDLVIGGTSAVAPLWAGLIVRLAQRLGHPLGLLQPQLYRGVQAGSPAGGFRDVTVGDNGAYTAAPGWDACTGLGSPNGTDLLARLGGQPG